MAKGKSSDGFKEGMFSFPEPDHRPGFTEWRTPHSQALDNLKAYTSFVKRERCYGVPNHSFLPLRSHGGGLSCLEIAELT
jgi:hypothetical protein